MQFFKYFLVAAVFLGAACSDPEPGQTEAEQAIDKKQKEVLSALEEHKNYLESDQYKIDQKKRIERMEETRKRAREFFEYQPSDAHESKGTKE